MAYSRSGTNWLRYFIEVTAEQPTPGHERHIKGRQDYCIDRAHAGFPIASKHPKIILVLRDYRECLIRHHTAKKIRTYPSIASFLSDTKPSQPASWYIQNIAAFDAFPKEKLLLYYESLIQEPERELKRLAEFLNLKPEKTQAFLKQLPQHQQASIGHYQKNQKSETSGNPKHLQYHAQKLSPEQGRAFDAYYQEHYPKLFEQYLSRYQTRN